METRLKLSLFILSFVMISLCIGCQTFSGAQRDEQLRIAQTIERYSAPEGTVGVARFYAKRYNGRRTTSGEIYNSKKLTAAHPVLPLGTRVKVVNLANNKAVIVKINDRCRDHEESFIDLSRQAAREIGMIKQGKANVRIIIVENDNPLPEDPALSKK